MSLAGGRSSMSTSYKMASHVSHQDGYVGRIEWQHEPDAKSLILAQLLVLARLVEKCPLVS